MNAVVNARIVVGDAILENKAVLFDEKIRDVVDLKELRLDGVNVIDARGMYLSAGFIDTHIHGIAGKDTMDATPEALKAMSVALSRVGVTSFLPTTVSADWDSVKGVLDNVRLVKEDVEGANILGVHLEGPFINPQRAGAHDRANIIRPDYSLVVEYKDLIKIVTYAPEMDDGMDFTKRALVDGIYLSVGHTEASCRDTMKAISMGVNRATHLFNGMKPLHHRDIGVVGAVLMSNLVYCELIADNVHVSPDLYNFVVRLKGKERIVLVSDSTKVALGDNGTYDLWGSRKVFYDGTSVRFEDGTLAGSALTLNKAIFNFWRATALPLHEVVSMATLNPARSMGLVSKGSLSIGKDADMVVFDNNLDVYFTIVGGRTKYVKRGF